jgi:hypothetical protein
MLISCELPQYSEAWRSSRQGTGCAFRGIAPGQARYTAAFHDLSDDPSGGVYGAAHVPPLVTYLTVALGYIVAGAEWITVFDY